MTSSKNDYANYDQSAPNFDLAHKTICVSVSSYLDQRRQLWVKEVEEFSIMLDGKMG